MPLSPSLLLTYITRYNFERPLIAQAVLKSSHPRYFRKKENDRLLRYAGTVL